MNEAALATWKRCEYSYTRTTPACLIAPSTTLSSEANAAVCAMTADGRLSNPKDEVRLERTIGGFLSLVRKVRA